ncbi:hypothetical protein OG301_39180 (plasmid) [Streptomyces platensis]|uniref:hypothetical protein n=1 Tax=Streptomyces platensis TaxID=58346 RepID=UPI002ED1E56F|nr:hypothetical protein OG301_39180 [Streptomyces platensis]
MFAKRSAKKKTQRRHRALLNLANGLLREAFLRRHTSADVTAQDLVSHAFGHQIDVDLDLDEAQRFLDAARVARGETAPQAAA